MTAKERVQLRPVDLGDADKVQRWYAEPLTYRRSLG